MISDDDEPRIADVVAPVADTVVVTLRLVGIYSLLFIFLIDSERQPCSIKMRIVLLPSGNGKSIVALVAY